MITSNGKVLQIHGKRLCIKCNRETDHTCFHMKYRKSPTNIDAIQKEERWVCDRCHAERIVLKEMPEPTERSMLVKLLMSLNERYELAGSSIEVRAFEVKATFRFPEHDMPKLREIANNWADRGYITAKHLMMVERAGMADVSKIPPRIAPSRRDVKRETMRRIFED
jgi:NAD-dependent SIR2 family protein deacetylase